MKFQGLATIALAASAIASPISKRQAYPNIDGSILQYALTLEHLENVFYKTAVTKFTEADFVAAGFTPFFYSQLKYIAHDEEAHVVYLTAGIKAAGLQPVAACTYKFPMLTPKQFIATAATIEGVGVSAYLGAAPLVTSKSYLTAAGAILVTEAIHQSATRYATGEIPMANVVGTPLGLNAVYSIASQFIASCPSTNAPLPVKAYPGLTETTGLPVSINIPITFKTDVKLPATYFFTFVSGLDIVPVAPGTSQGMMSAVVPAVVQGQAYVFITSDNSGNVTDATVLAGPAIIEVTPSSPTFDVSIV